MQVGRAWQPLGARMTFLAFLAWGAGVAIGSTGGAVAKSGALRLSLASVSAVQTNDLLNAVSCAARRDCMAVGEINNPPGGGENMLAERWDGRRWLLQRLPTPPKLTVDQLNGISCPSIRMCLAVGIYFHASRHGVGIGFHAWGPGLPLAERWNGRRWSIQHPVNLGGWARDGGGVTWLNAVSCATATDCTAVGSYFGPTSYPGAGTLTEHWNGKRWSVQKTPTSDDSNASLSSVSCPSLTSCVAVGGTQKRPVAERWTGTRWSRVRIPEPAQSTDALLTAVDCASVRACIAVGAFTTHRVVPGTPVAVTGMADRWNGKTWTVRRIRALTGHGLDSGASSVSCASTHVCMAVGQGATVELKGTRWSAEIPSPLGLTGVSCPSQRTCIAVGGAIAGRWNGTRWASQPIANPGL